MKVELEQDDVTLAWAFMMGMRGRLNDRGRKALSNMERLVPQLHRDYVYQQCGFAVSEPATLDVSAASAPGPGPCASPGTSSPD